MLNQVKSITHVCVYARWLVRVQNRPRAAERNSIPHCIRLCAVCRSGACECVRCACARTLCGLIAKKWVAFVPNMLFAVQQQQNATHVFHTRARAFDMRTCECIQWAAYVGRTKCTPIALCIRAISPVRVHGNVLCSVRTSSVGFNSGRWFHWHRHWMESICKLFNELCALRPRCSSHIRQSRWHCLRALCSPSISSHFSLIAFELRDARWMTLKLVFFRVLIRAARKTLPHKISGNKSSIFMENMRQSSIELSSIDTEFAAIGVFSVAY